MRKKIDWGLETLGHIAACALWISTMIHLFHKEYLQIIPGLLILLILKVDEKKTTEFTIKIVHAHPDTETKGEP